MSVYTDKTPEQREPEPLRSDAGIAVTLECIMCDGEIHMDRMLGYRCVKCGSFEFSVTTGRMQPPTS